VIPPFLSIRAPRGALVLAAVVLLAQPALSAGAEQAPDLDEARDELEAITDRIEAAAAERDSLDAELRGLLAQLTGHQAEMRAIQADLEATAGRVEALEEGIRSGQDALDRRAAQVYMNPPVGVLDAVLSAKSLSEAGDVLYFLAESAQSDADLIVRLANERTRLGWQQARLEDLQKSARAAIDRLDRLAAELGDRLAQQRELVDQLARDAGEAAALVDQLSEQQREAPPPEPEPEPSPDPPKPPDPGPEAVKALIRDYFAPLGQHTVDVALCVAGAESGFDPHAENPYTGAAGVFQFIPSTWESLSEAAGWGGVSVFDAEANVAVAAWTVEHSGWGAWPVAEDCGA
jgi:peptidoglycan hydrolase CwlO-like protein